MLSTPSRGLRLPCALMLFLGFAGSACAQVTLAGWNAFQPSAATFPRSANTTNSTYLSAATLSTTGLTATTDSRTVFSGWDPRASVNLTTDYIQLSLTTAQNVSLSKLYYTGTSLTALVLDVRSSADNYATSLGTFDLNTPSLNYVNFTADLSSLNFVSGGITLRLYGYNSSSAVGNGSYAVAASNSYTGYTSAMGSFAISITGAAAIPEPAHSAALAALALLAISVHRRRRAA